MGLKIMISLTEMTWKSLEIRKRRIFPELADFVLLETSSETRELRERGISI